jgi:chorismate mutase/prephenate dehydrogenase
MTELDILRQKIDTVDAEILTLLAKRLQIVQEVAEYKAKNDIPVYQPGREAEIMAKIKDMATKKDLDPEYVEEMFKIIMRFSKESQQRLLDRVA